jgi:hypothetical protein
MPKIGLSAIARATKGAAIAAPVRDLRTASQNYRRLLSRGQQFELAGEIAETRGRELCLAYRNLISVGSGYKVRRSGPWGKAKLVRIPCVVFVVSRKWRTPGRKGDVQRLPKDLLTYGTIGGKRIRFAVPTDVKPVSWYGKPKPRSYAGVVLRQPPTRPVIGAMTCAIRRSDNANRSYALSCRHVFSMSLESNPEAERVEVRTAEGSLLVGKTTAIRGGFVKSPEYSFDAQLAEIHDVEAFKKGFGGLRFDSKPNIAMSRDDLPKSGFYIVTPRKDADNRRLRIWVDYEGTNPFGFSYPLAKGEMMIVHEELIFTRASEILENGDSGSPAVTNLTGGKFLGMYIGGDDGRAFIIPAWQLLQPWNYGLSPALSLSLVGQM